MRLILAILALLATEGGVIAAAEPAHHLPLTRTGPSAGAKVGPDGVAAIAKQLRRCFELTPDEFNGGYVVSITVNLDQHGGIAGDPILDSPPRSQLQRDVARAVVRAVRACAPYGLPPEAYDDWKQLKMTFKP